MDPEMPKQKASFTILQVPVFPPVCSQNSKGCFYIAQYTLRCLVIALTLAGAIIMTTSNQTVTVFGIPMHARYTYSSAFRFKVVADSVVCGISLLSVVLVVGLNLVSNPKNYFYLLLHDLVSVVVLLSGCSAATAIGYVGRFGQDETGWVAICDPVPKFCDKIMVSIASSFLAVICLLALILMSAYNLNSVSSSYLDRISIKS